MESTGPRSRPIDGALGIREGPLKTLAVAPGKANTDELDVRQAHEGQGSDERGIEVVCRGICPARLVAAPPVEVMIVTGFEVSRGR